MEEKTMQKTVEEAGKSGNPLGSRKVTSLLRQFAIPSIVAMMVSSLYNVVDQIFIGQGVGYLGNGATNVAFPFSTICMAIALLVGIGSASSYSLYLGRGEEKKAKECVGNGVFMMVTLGVLYAILVEIFLVPLLWVFGATDNNIGYAIEYMRIIAIGMPLLVVTNGTCNLIRADGSPKFSMACMVTGAVINMILDPIFILALDMGMTGAALATVISQVISCGMAVSYYRRFKHVKLDIRSFTIRPRECAKQASYGLSNSLNQLAITVVQIVMNQTLLYYGARSVYGADIPQSACGVVFKINSLFLAVFIGLSQGSQPIVGFNYGAKQYKRVRDTYKCAILVAFVVGLIGVGCFHIFSHQLISLFGSGDALYYQFAEKFMKTYLMMMPAIGIQLVSANFFSAIGKPGRGVILSLSRQILFLIPLLIVFPMIWGIEGVMYTAPISDSVSCLLSVCLILVEFAAMHREERATASSAE